MTDEKALLVMLKSDEVRDRFIQTAGRAGGAWITAVINAANLNPTIWECEPVSVVTAGLNAASLRLSLDPSLGQACILPFSKSRQVNGKWVKEKRATFVPMARGLKQMASRTGKYRYINSTPVYEGETIREDRMSGIQYLEGKRTGDNIIGYYAAFELLTGMIATQYMTAEECLEHGKTYSPSFDKKSNKFYSGSKWVDDFPTMAEKTVMRRLILHDGVLDPNDRTMLEAIDDEGEALEPVELPEDTIEGEFIERHTETENMQALGFGDTEPKTTITKRNGSKADPGKRPYSPEVVKEGISSRASKIKNFQPNEKQQQLFRYATGDLLFPGDQAVEDKRHTLTLYLTGSASSHAVSGSMFKAIIEDWLKLDKDSGGAYEIDSMARKEAEAIVKAALVAEGQQELL